MDRDAALAALRAHEPELKRRKRVLAQRRIEIVSEARRRVAAEIASRHPEIIWRLARNSSPELERVCRQEAAAAVARDQKSGL